MKYDEYLKLLDTEVRFWQKWFSTNGMHWPEDFSNRLNPASELSDALKKFVPNHNVKILDVGSGPITVLGRNMDGKQLNIIATDILADEYMAMYDAFGIDKATAPLKVAAEELSQFFKHRKFDFIHAQNSIDHCFNPFEAIRQMLAVLKTNGTIYLRHEVCEAENENYTGIHQWNFELRKNGFAIWNKEVKKYLTDVIPEIDVDATQADGYVVTVITKR